MISYFVLPQRPPFLVDGGWGELLNSLVFVLTIFILQYHKLYRERKIFEISSENLKIAKEHAEIEALKLQIDPHFLFNSLNILNFFIGTEQKKAKEFLQVLAGIYRYILINKSKQLVFVKEELNFCQDYVYLLKGRFGDNLQSTFETLSLTAEEYLIPPISIQILIENAVKHNSHTSEFPLHIKIIIEEDNITVTNRKRALQKKSESLQLGLRNLKERFNIIVQRPIEINETMEYFTVILPLVKL
ncbi:MAG TPA: histidine kinase [Chitinophagaceae bacterium]|nr:histidine kinase [Chitinophagaceae bacterium]